MYVVPSWCLRQHITFCFAVAFVLITQEQRGVIFRLPRRFPPAFAGNLRWIFRFTSTYSIPTPINCESRPKNHIVVAHAGRPTEYYWYRPIPVRSDANGQAQFCRVNRRAFEEAAHQ